MSHTWSPRQPSNKTALLTHRNVADLVVEAGLMSREEVTKQLSPARLSGLEAITEAITIIRPAENIVPGK